MLLSTLAGVRQALRERLFPVLATIQLDPVRGVYLAGCFLILLVLAVGTWIIWQSHDADERKTLQALAQQSISLSEQMSQVFHSADLVLNLISQIARFDAQDRLIDT